MSRQISAIIVYPPSALFTEHILPVLTKQFKYGILNGENTDIGSMSIYVFDARVPEDFVLNDVEKRIREELPNVHVHMVEPQLGSWWTRHQSHVFIGLITGLGGLLLVQAMASFMKWVQGVFR